MKKKIGNVKKLNNENVNERKWNEERNERKLREMKQMKKWLVVVLMKM